MCVCVCVRLFVVSGILLVPLNSHLKAFLQFVFNTVMAGDDDVEAGDEDIDDLP